MERPRGLLAEHRAHRACRAHAARSSGVAHSPLAAVGEREACFTHGLSLHGPGKVPARFPDRCCAKHGHSPCFPATLPDPSCSPPG